MPKLFVSYRRVDSVQVTGRIYDRLTAEFGRENVFKDVDTIPLGTDFRKVLNGWVAQCDVFIAVIGRHWLEVKTADGKRRIDQHDDFVRVEVEAALQRDIPVIPVLVDDTTLPTPEELPESIKDLTYRGAISVGVDPDFHTDVNRLISGIKAIEPVGANNDSGDRKPKKRKEKLSWATPAATAGLLIAIGAGVYTLWPDRSDVTPTPASVAQHATQQSIPTSDISAEGAAKTRINELLQKAQASLTKNELTAPRDVNVVHYAGQILQSDADNVEAKQLLQTVVARFHGWANDNISKNDFKTAASYLKSSKRVIDDFGLSNLAQQHAELADKLEKQRVAKRLADEQRAAEAERKVNEKKQLTKQKLAEEPARKAEKAQFTEQQEATEIKSQVELILEVMHSQQQDLLESTMQLDQGLTLKPIPSGSFMMGGNNGVSREKPVHKVTINYPFWMSETEITFAQYDAYAEATNKDKSSDGGWGRGNRPVIYVSWHDAQDYVKWLTSNNSKGLQCRLPSEAEWEYAVRARPNATEKENTKYSWGNNIGKNNANCAGCGSQWDDSKTAPVKSFKANAFGLYDMHGNVWEWVQDNWHDNYQGAPTEGSVWQGGDARRRVLRGGSWDGTPFNLRSADRLNYDPVNRYYNIGFRIVCSPPSVR